MFWLWYTRGRDPEVGSVAVQYEPPQGLTPGEVGTLVDDEAAMRDITATIVDLAVHGFLTIEERPKPHLMGLYSNTEYVFHMKKQPAEWAGAKPHELLLLAALFDNGGRGEVELAQLQNKFYTNLPGIRSALFDSLMEHGYYIHRPDKVRQGFIAAGAIAGILLWVAGDLPRPEARHATPSLYRRGYSYRSGGLRLRLVHALAHRRWRPRISQRAGLRGLPLSRRSGPHGAHDFDARDL